MGIYTNLATGSQTIKTAKPRIGLGRASAQYLLAQAATLDPPIRTALAAADEVQSIPHQASSGALDTYTLTIRLPGLQRGTFTTAAIAFDAVDTVIETAIDVAATAAAVTDWTNADISIAMVAAAGVSDGIVTITFDGASVTEQVALLTDMTCTGWTQDGVITRTTDGGPDREAMQAMIDLGIVAGAAPSTGDAPTWTRPTLLSTRTRPRVNVIQDLAQQSSYEEGTDEVASAVKTLYPELQ